MVLICFDSMHILVSFACTQHGVYSWDVAWALKYDYIMLSHTPRIGITIWFSYQHSNLMQISFWSHPDANLGIATKFCICHDSCAVVACVKNCSVLITRCWELKTRINFSSGLNCGHHIFSVMPLWIYEKWQGVWGWFIADKEWNNLFHDVRNDWWHHN